MMPLLDFAVTRKLSCGPKAVILRPSRPVGRPASRKYINGAARLDCRLSPAQLLAWAQQVEVSMGREPGVRWGPRPVDIDLLLFNRVVLETAELVLPHPRMAFRRFVLEPAHEIAANMLHVTTGWTVSTLLTRLREAPNYVAVAGAHGSKKSQLVSHFAERAHLLLDPTTVTDSRRADAERLPAERSLAASRAAMEARFEQLGSIVERLADPNVGLVISDYWFGQSLVAARTWFQGPARRQLEARCRELLELLPIPILMLFLDTPVERLASSRPEADEAARRLGARFCRELQWQVALPGQGPILRVPDGDLTIARRELEAALIAMH